MSDTKQENPSSGSGKQEFEEAYKKARFWLAVNVGLFIFALVILIAVFVMVMNTTSGLDGQSAAPASDQQAQKRAESQGSRAGMARRLIDGVWVEQGEEKAPLAAVVIDNHVNARPPAGLSEALFVYEAEVEGGITRYLAIYSQAQEVERIGPIRSARPYFLDLADGLSALFVHVGGSPAALAQIASSRIENMNQFYQGDYFWRDESRPRPHNVYTSSRLINSFAENKGVQGGEIGQWKFKPEKESGKRPQDTDPIIIRYTFEGHVVKWLYNHSDNEYLRYLDSEPHKDAAGNLVKAKNVAIQKVEGEVLDEKLRLELKDVGKGDAIICLDGECRSGEWEKESRDARTRFYDAKGEEVEFNAGTTWVELVRPHIEMDY